MTTRDFWQTVYLTALNTNKNSADAVIIANTAVQNQPKSKERN